jgi:hypothetical protein
MNACIRVILAAAISQNAVSVKDSSRTSPITVKIRIGLRADARQAWPGTE